MVKQGVYYGVYEQGDLIAAAGTHLLAAQTGVAAVGNVYTRSDRRGRGLAPYNGRGGLASAGASTIVPNVNQKNAGDGSVRIARISPPLPLLGVASAARAIRGRIQSAA
jgi:hypothetical protein